MPDIITSPSAIGIDLGDTDAHYAFVNDEGKLMEEGRVAMTPAGMRKTFAGCLEPALRSKPGRSRDRLPSCLASWVMK